MPLRSVTCRDLIEVVLSGRSVTPICGGQVVVVTRPLPGRAICAALEQDGVLWVVMDLDKAAAPRHALTMLRNWMARRGALPLPPEAIRLPLLTGDPLLPAVTPARFSLVAPVPA